MPEKIEKIKITKKELDDMYDIEELIKEDTITEDKTVTKEVEKDVFAEFTIKYDKQQEENDTEVYG